MAALIRTRRRLRNGWRFFLADRRSAWAIAIANEQRARHPGFLEAVVADARTAASRRDERPCSEHPLDIVLQVIRLAVVTDSFFAQVCYRAKAGCQAHAIPLLPRLFHRLAIRNGQICIGDLAVLAPGVHIPHGQIVIDALTTVGAGATLSPFTTLGRIAGVTGGPKIGALAVIGTGAKVLGPVEVGARAKVGANSVVISNVPNDATAVGAPARVVAGQTTNET